MTKTEQGPPRNITMVTHGDGTLGRDVMSVVTELLDRRDAEWQAWHEQRIATLEAALGNIRESAQDLLGRDTDIPRGAAGRDKAFAFGETACAHAIFTIRAVDEALATRAGADTEGD